MKFEKPIPGHWDSREGANRANVCLSVGRGELTMCNMTDFHLANAQYLASQDRLETIVYQQAAKERIRWLSAHLARATALLEDVKQQCLIADDGGIGVTEEPHISLNLFDRICDATRETGYASLSATKDKSDES